MKITKHRKKGKVGVSFRRTGLIHYRNDWMLKETMEVLLFDWTGFKYNDFKIHVAQIMHTRKDSGQKNLPIVIVGNASFPPMPFEVNRYYLYYDPDNFIGEYEMSLYGENAFLIFHLHYPEDFVKYKEIAHRIVYLGSLCRIVFAISSDAALTQKIIKEENIIDYDIFFLKDTNQYIPYGKHRHKVSESFEFLVSKNI